MKEAGIRAWGGGVAEQREEKGTKGREIKEKL